MVAITIAKRIPFPLNSRKENANAAREQEMICPMVIHPAMINEFKMNRRSGTVVNASLKFCSVGCFGKRFRSVVNNSLDGISAMLTAYKSGSSTRIAKMIFAARRSAVLLLLFASALAFILFFNSRSSLFEYFPSIGIAILFNWLISNLLPSSQCGTSPMLQAW